ncbi:MAG: hypothetical protein LBS11_07135 [Oscillospiraceae bacterium]|jgi:hypothetical protein|nr:hypothetical protein [Oscillospiraceae bacterium]
MIRKDWLDELGLGIPVTLADWEETALMLMDEKDLVSGLAIATNDAMVYSRVCGTSARPTMLRTAQ